ncbi:MAG: hypothetical protein KGL39_48760 [Patescibacteria group bacterium]|nr:hypothetical protein [Patescibacteria group bacterium]
MTGVGEAFVTQIARAARQSRALRRLRGEDRRDAIAMTVAWCWEHRAEFDQQTLPLVEWVHRAMERARWELRNAGAREHAYKYVEEMARNDEEAEREMLHHAMENAMRHAGALEAQIATALLEGHTHTDIRAGLQLSHAEFRHALWKIRGRLKDVTAERQPQVYAQMRARLSDHDERGPSRIDHEIEKLLRRPKHAHADCPPCWRCMYFEGLTPRAYKPTVLSDTEVQTAVRNTETLKIKIGNGETV